MSTFLFPRASAMAVANLAFSAFVILFTAAANGAIISNGGFEQPVVPTNSYAQVTPTSWTWNGLSGWIMNGTVTSDPWAAAFPPPEQGQQYACIGDSPSYGISQAFQLSTPGTYTASWYDSCASEPSQILAGPYTVAIINSNLNVVSSVSFVPYYSDVWLAGTMTTSLSAGTYNLSFEPTGAYLSDSVLIDNVSMTPSFPLNASGWLVDWNIASNWGGGVIPINAGDHAVFNSTSPQTVATNLPVTLGTLDLIASASTTITGGYPNGGLTMQTSSGTDTAQINVAGGTTHLINLPLSFNSPTGISVTGGSTLLISNPINLNGHSVTKTGGGTLQCDVNFSASTGTLQANAGAVAIGAEAIVSLALLDIAGNAQLSGSGTIQGDATYESSAASRFAGTIAGAGSSLVLNANGGSLTLTGSNTYGGGTEVLNGTLIATNYESLPDGGSLTVGANAAAMFDRLQAASSLAVSPAAAAVPEPSTSALLGVGLVGLIAHGWRRR